MKNRWIALMISSLVSLPPAFTPSAHADTDALPQLFPVLAEIQLTPAQQVQLKQLSQQTLPKVQQVLSPAQRTQFNTALTSGQSIRVALTSLDLSMPQKFQLRSVLQSARSQLTQILTPEQQQQLMQKAHAFRQSH